MSLRLKQLSGRDVVAVLVRFGFDVVGTRGSHCKMRRTLPAGERQTLTIPLHASLAPGTLHAIYRQACRFVPEADLQPHFYSGAATKLPERSRAQSEHITDPQPAKNAPRREQSRRGRRRQ